MKKYANKVLLLVLVMLMTAVAFTGCGKKSTLEEYVNNNSKEAEALETSSQTILKSLKLDDIATINYEINNNDLIFNIQFTSQGEGMILDNMKKSLETAFESEDTKKGFNDILTKLIAGTNVEDIKMVFNFLNHDGTNIYSKTFSIEK